MKSAARRFAELSYNGGMKPLRLIIVCLLSLAIPLSALAANALAMVQNHCPKQHSMAQHPVAAATTGVSGADNHDCCDTGHAGTGESKQSDPCQSGHGCKAWTAVPVPVSSAVPVFLLVLAPQRFDAVPGFFLPSHGPSGLWRPPRLI